MISTRSHAQRIPSLDGLRAIAIGVVLLGHLTGTGGFPSWVGVWVESDYFDIAHLGVRVFFVISGFLITGLLIDESTETGRISLPRFYLRRSLRILPAYLALVLAVGLLVDLGLAAASSRDFVHALTYTMNYARPRAKVLGHLWSLSVEEQFYLLWPAVIAVAGLRRAKKAALIVICVVPIIRVIEFMLWPHWLIMIGETFETTADSLAMGCLLALSRDALFVNHWYRRLMYSRWAALTCVVLGYVIALRYRPGLLVGRSLIGVGIVLVIDRCVRRPDGMLGRLLNARPVAFVGTISYSLYLWQQIFLDRTRATSVFPRNIILAFLTALASYYLVERPALRLRPRIEAWFDRHRTVPRLPIAPAAGG